MNDTHDSTLQDHTIDQFALDAGMSFPTRVDQIQALTHELEQAEVFDAESAASETLAEYAAALKALKDAAEEARKDVFEAELDERTDINDEIGPLTKRRGSNKSISDEQAAIDALEAAGADPTQAMALKRTKFEDLAEAVGVDPDEYVDTYEYSYFRRRS